MRSILLIIISLPFLFSDVYAGQGIIIKYNSFFYQKPSIKSLKLKVVNKGDRIFIHDKYFDPHFKNISQEIFLETIDNNGLVAYIKESDVKLIYNDDREELQNREEITSKIDSTDFRPKEPISPTFPFKVHENYRGMFDIGHYSTGSLVKYDYPSLAIKSNFGTGIIVRLTLLKKANWDKDNRFFVGANLALSSKPSAFQLSNGLFSTELNTTFEFGPSLSYDFYKINSTTLTLISSLNILYHKYFVKIEKSISSREERKFAAFSLKPNFSFLWQNISPTSHYNIYAGFSGIYSINQTLKPTTNIGSVGAWNPTDDVINLPSAFEWSLFLGISNHF